MIIFELLDGYYRPPQKGSPAEVFKLADRPLKARKVKFLDLTVVGVRAVFEGEWLDRALAFASHGPARQRALFRHEPAVGHQLRQIARLEPKAIETLRDMWGPRCIPRAVLRAAAHSRHRGDWAAQVRAATDAVGPRQSKALLPPPPVESGVGLSPRDPSRGNVSSVA